jgi:hypothetical protein
MWEEEPAATSSLPWLLLVLLVLSVQRVWRRTRAASLPTVPAAMPVSERGGEGSSVDKAVPAAVVPLRPRVAERRPSSSPATGGLFLYSGSCFEGVQRNGDDDCPVHVRILVWRSPSCSCTRACVRSCGPWAPQHVDPAQAILSGYLSISGITSVRLRGPTYVRVRRFSCG